MEFIDSHTHLDGSQFDKDREETIQRAKDAGLVHIINIGATNGFQGAERSIALIEKHDFLYATAGIHPHDAETAFDIAKLKELVSHPKMRAIGETGLDFFKDWSPRDLQYKWFQAQVELALEMKMPLVIHCRNAASECFEVLQKMGASKVGGVFHCFGEDAAFAKKLEELNFIVSLPGTITFKKATALREAVQEIPLERIMIETDAPYLSPEPLRGKRCESSYVTYTAQKLAEIKNISLEEVARVTTANARKFYDLPE